MDLWFKGERDFMCGKVSHKGRPLLTVHVRANPNRTVVDVVTTFKIAQSTIKAEHTKKAASAVAALVDMFHPDVKEQLWTNHPGSNIQLYNYILMKSNELISPRQEKHEYRIFFR